MLKIPCTIKCQIATLTEDDLKEHKKPKQSYIDEIRSKLELQFKNCEPITINIEKGKAVANADIIDCLIRKCDYVDDKLNIVPYFPDDDELDYVEGYTFYYVMSLNLYIRKSYDHNLYFYEFIKPLL